MIEDLSCNLCAILELASTANCVDYHHASHIVIGMCRLNGAFPHWFKGLLTGFNIICFGKFDNLIEVDGISISDGAILRGADQPAIVRKDAPRRTGRMQISHNRVERMRHPMVGERMIRVIKM